MANLIDKKVKLLKEFGIRITPTIFEDLTNLYPNEIAMENYCRSILRNHLDRIAEIQN